MAASLSYTAGVKGQGSYAGSSANSALKDSISLGQNGFEAADVPFTTGIGDALIGGAMQANDWYRDQLTIAAGATVNIDLAGGAQLNRFGTPLGFASVRYVLIAINAPDGVQRVLVGPQGVANAAQLGFAGVGADAAEEVFWHKHMIGPIEGWPVAVGTADLLPITNPGAAPVVVNVLILGVK